jgi:hypothetical protein
MARRVYYIVFWLGKSNAELGSVLAIASVGILKSERLRGNFWRRSNPDEKDISMTRMRLDLFDASGSFDRDVNIGASNLSYTWSCMTTAPVLSSACNGLKWLTPQNVSIVEVQALNTTSTSYTFIISVTVYDSKRSDKGSVTIGVLGQSKPIAIISSSFPTKVNPASKIVVDAYIENIFGSVNASWSAVSSAGYDIDVSSDPSDATYHKTDHKVYLDFIGGTAFTLTKRYRYLLNNGLVFWKGYNDSFGP